jgi:hypothetical protein
MLILGYIKLWKHEFGRNQIIEKEANGSVEK